jgi:uncharacterized membrane protein YgcG
MARVTKRLARTRRALKPVAIAGAVGLGLLQLVPYGWSHSNPPVTGSPPWPSAEVEGLARAACYDCHSNETEWPPYSYVVPMSWLVRYDIDRGRDALNFSEWGADGNDAHDAAEEVEDGSMPLDRYVRLHPGARLSAEDRQALVAALEAMDEDGRGGEGGGEGGGGGGGNRGPGGPGGGGSDD